MPLNTATPPYALTDSSIVKVRSEVVAGRIKGASEVQIMTPRPARSGPPIQRYWSDLAVEPANAKEISTSCTTAGHAARTDVGDTGRRSEGVEAGAAEDVRGDEEQGREGEALHGREARPAEVVRRRVRRGVVDAHHGAYTADERDAGDEPRVHRHHAVGRAIAEGEEGGSGRDGETCAGVLEGRAEVVPLETLEGLGLAVEEEVEADGPCDSIRGQDGRQSLADSFRSHAPAAPIPTLMPTLPQSMPCLAPAPYPYASFGAVATPLLAPARVHAPLSASNAELGCLGVGCEKAARADDEKRRADDEGAVLAKRRAAGATGACAWSAVCATRVRANAAAILCRSNALRESLARKRERVSEVGRRHDEAGRHPRDPLAEAGRAWMQRRTSKERHTLAETASEAGEASPFSSSSPFSRGKWLDRRSTPLRHYRLKNVSLDALRAAPGRLTHHVLPPPLSPLLEPLPSSDCRPIAAHPLLQPLAPHHLARVALAPDLPPPLEPLPPKHPLALGFGERERWFRPVRPRGGARAEERFEESQEGVEA